MAEPINLESLLAKVHEESNPGQTVIGETPDMSETLKQVIKLHTENTELMQWMSQFGVAVDILSARFELLFNKMVEWGIISQEQDEGFELLWETTLANQLREQKAQIAQQIRMENMNRIKRGESPIRVPGS